MIEVQKLVKRYGDRVAVDGLSFEVDKGEVVGFLGPNGAGKSTTMRILAGFLGMTSGKVTAFGKDLREQSFEARQMIGYMPEAVPLYGEMRVVEYLNFRAELKRVPRRDRARFVDEAMEKANVKDVATTLIGSLSKGYKQRVGLADALVAKPPLLILDEPTAGLDPNQIREVREVLRELGKDHTVLLSTHILSEVEASCSRALVIAKGKLVTAGTMDDLARKRRSVGVVFVVRGNPEITLSLARAESAIAKAARDEGARNLGDGVHAVNATWNKKVEEGDAARAIEAVVAGLVKAGSAVREVRPVRSSLEEVFAELTRGDARGADEAAEGGAS